MTAQEVLVHSLTYGQQILNQYLGDLTPSEYLHRPHPQANCAAWVIGHLILLDRATLATLGAGDMPSLPDGFEARFAREGDAPRAGQFGDVAALLPLFNRCRQQLIEATRKASPELLDKPLDKPHPRFKTVGERIRGIGLHAVMHAGQLTMIRRSLGRPPIV